MATIAIKRECMGGPMDGLVVACDLKAEEVRFPVLRHPICVDSFLDDNPSLPSAGQVRYRVGADGKLHYEDVE